MATEMTAPLTIKVTGFRMATMQDVVIVVRDGFQWERPYRASMMPLLIWTGPWRRVGS